MEEESKKSLGKSPNEDRNEALVILHKLNPGYFGVSQLGRVFFIKKQTATDILQRDYDKYDLKRLPKSSGVIHRKKLDKRQ